jgi:D-alanyl-lipoteichoic acid acyltransferase DltB (MBOAT superfamily)
VLFNSFIFVFGFLPVALLLTYTARYFGRQYAIVLTVLSLIFYAWWRPSQTPILLFSIVFNFVVGRLIQKAVFTGRQNMVRLWLALGVAVDLAMLGWFKYANFVADNLAALVGTQSTLAKIALPLGISFYTFQKIAYLVDSARGEAKKMSFREFALFASFFPQLLAGPIVHYKEMVPQFESRRFGRINWTNVLVGLVIFAIGLFKKTVIADTLNPYANSLFALPDHGGKLGLIGGWTAALTYTLQLYFDFSGYSDMAIGAARMLGVKLPLNFHSPLRASNIADYWRRWHMTLQRFIVAYLFQPLSLPLNRWAATRGLSAWPSFIVCVGIPTLVTFVAVGAWHNAGWTFIAFGLMHAIYINAHEALSEFQKQRRRKLKKADRPLPPLQGPGHAVWARAVTLLAIIYANVMFRAHSVSNAVSVWGGMTGLNGLDFAGAAQAWSWGLAASLAVGLFIVFMAPNTQQIMGRFDPAWNWRDWRDVGRAPLSWTWKPNAAGLLFAGGALFIAIMFIQRGQAVFLYFNF